MSDHVALRALGAADPHRAGGRPADDERLLRAILATPRPERRRRRRGVIAVAICLLALGATGAYATLADRDAARVDAALQQAARDARPLTAGELAAIERSNAADEALYRCLQERGAQTDSSGGLNPAPAIKAACAAESAAAGAAHRDPAVRAAFAAEAELIGAAWFCVQQRGYPVNGNRMKPDIGAAERAAIWDAFAACEAEVGVPAAHRTRRP